MNPDHPPKPEPPEVEPGKIVAFPVPKPPGPKHATNCHHPRSERFRCKWSGQWRGNRCLACPGNKACKGPK
jgi:hypothetical protein